MTLCSTKALHWKAWLEDITEADIWHTSRIASSAIHDSSTPCILTLHATSAANPVATHEYSNAKDKSHLFTDIFFPPKPAHVPSLPGDNSPFPDPLPFIPPSVDQIRRCILRLQPHKAPGPDKIPNIVLRSAVHIIAPLLHRCLLTILNLKYFPAAWRSWLTIVLQKPGWPDYTIPKAY